jgi:hypothetical protein
MCHKAHTTQAFSIFNGAAWGLSLFGDALLRAKSRPGFRRSVFEDEDEDEVENETATVTATVTATAAAAPTPAPAEYACVSDMMGMWLMSYRHRAGGCFKMTRL